MSIKSELHEAILRKGGKIPTHGGIAAALDELNRLPSGGGVTSWNDLTDKPFYTEKGATVLAETTVEVTADFSEAYLPDVLPIEVGKAYCVNWNGVDYVVIAESDDTLGVAIAALNSDGNFKIMCLDAATAASMGVGTGVVVLDGSTVATLSIYAATVHALPVYYLPKMTVNVTVDASDQGNHKVDKTTDEITDAIKAGYFVECRLNLEGDIYVLYLNRYIPSSSYPEVFDTYFTSLSQSHETTVTITKMPSGGDKVSHFAKNLG